MKMIMAVIQPHRLDAVRDALEAINVHGLTASEVKGFGQQRGHKEIYRGAEYQINYVPKVKLEIVVADDILDDAVDAIQQAARQGRVGDGKIFVWDVETTIRIRTGESGEGAV
ncbi:P-II family nitrogen regulator [Cucumibacter marinus]|uniref:P-II family nitrogen regulator n=1 Tax=Cucumibacter marinus TaxID=1121252 RepID=UPI00040B9E9E|nr:P-II family nitrogen regulator [Cucumibacter marinus]